MAEAQKGALPLVWEHLSRQRAAAGRQDWPYVSEVQLMVSEPCATDQSGLLSKGPRVSRVRFWHVDNASSGLTLVVPLTAVPEDMGATLLLPGSHGLFSQASSSFICLRNHRWKGSV